MDIITFLSAVEPIGVPLFVGLGSFIIGRRKNNAETKKIESEADKTKVEIEKLEVERKLDELNLFDRIRDFYKEENSELLTKLRELQNEILELRIQVSDLTGNQCKGAACETVIAYNKIMVAREKRKKKQPTVIA